MKSLVKISGKFIVPMVVLSLTVVARQGYASLSFETGNTLYEKCQDNNSMLNSGGCMGYISAIVDDLASDNRINGFHACFSQYMTRGQVLDVVVKWLRDHPESRHLSANGLVARALSEAFPCSR